jgi:Protein of unknown function (DUF2568)
MQAMPIGANDRAGSDAGPVTRLGAPHVLLLCLRAPTEVGIVAGLGYWGFHSGGSTAAKLLLAVGAPGAGFGFWGAVDFRRAGRLAEPLRLLQELAVSGLAAVASFAAGLHALGIALASVSLVYHALVYILGERLLGSSAPSGNALRASGS